MKDARMTIWVMVAVLVIAVGQGFGLIQFNDGGTHDIDYALNESVIVQDEPFWLTSTTVNFLAGSSLSVDHSKAGLMLRGSSRLNVQGGLIDGIIEMFDDSVTSIYSGEFIHTDLRTDDSTLNISGGTFHDFMLSTQNSSEVSITGGTFPTIVELYIRGDTSMSVTGGIFLDDSNFHVAVQGSSSMLISGGMNYATYISVSENADLTIQGYDLQMNGIDLPSGSYGGYRSGFMTGYLLDGTGFEWEMYVIDNAILTVQNVPEPATLLLLGMGGFILRRKRG